MIHGRRRCARIGTRSAKPNIVVSLRCKRQHCIERLWPAKHATLYGIDRRRPLAETLFEQSGVAADEVTIVVNTHLHFDHAGGNTKLDAAGSVVATFPNARYFVSRAELDHAEQPTERDRASYLPDNWRPLVASGQLEPKEENYEVVPGLTMQTIAGHNRSMQCWRLERDGTTMFGFADLVPMRAHLRLPWIMIERILSNVET